MSQIGSKGTADRTSHYSIMPDMFFFGAHRDNVKSWDWASKPPAGNQHRHFGGQRHTAKDAFAIDSSARLMVLPEGT